MSEQRNPDTAGRPDDERSSSRGRKRAKPKPGSDSYFVGAIRIAEFRERSGYQSFYRVRIVDSYKGFNFSHWYHQEGISVYAKVEAVTNPAHTHLLGHLVRMELDPRYVFGRYGPVFSAATEASLAPAGYPWVAEIDGARTDS